MIGKTISHYKIIEKLGAGGMGVVYKAEDLKLKRLVALKTLIVAPDISRRKREIQKMVIEAQAAAKLNHPNIVTIHDVGSEKTRPYIAMEYIDGEPLSEIIPPEGIPDLYFVVDIIIQICEAISHAHEKGIIHRDLKPANIMLLKNKAIKVTDFGAREIWVYRR